ncbi:MAG: GntR family transcriptional regulator [Candidatus Limnocylindrales bacterium]
MVRRNVTLARQAAQEVAEGIQSGALAGEEGLLPSETALSHRLGVSRATLREALSQLEHGGLIVRRHGIGTFVAPRQPVVETGLEELESIETLARKTGVEIHMGDSDIRERPATAEEAAALAIAAGSPVLAVQRVMMSQERAIAFLVDVLPTEFLTVQELGGTFHGSVLDFMLQRGVPPLQHSYTELSAEAAGAGLARRLGLRAGAPLLRFVAQLYGAHGRVVDYSISYFRPGQFRFHVIRRVRQFPAVIFEATPADAAIGLPR